MYTTEALAGLRQLSAVLLKQHIKQRWDESASAFQPPEISDDEKALVRDALLRLLFAAPAPVCAPLSAGIAAIANTDFPEAWPNVLPTILGAATASDASQEVRAS